jgi:Na+/citrate or Na+/malate symporter
METDILLEGFKKAEVFGLRYTELIGDGDSSVHPTMVSQVPVWGHAITKVECANHAVKCYRSALENLVKKKPHYKGKGNLTERMSKRLTKAARCAKTMRSAEENRTIAVKSYKLIYITLRFTALGYTMTVALTIAK